MPNAAWLLPPKLSSAPAPNRATRATIAFPESDRPDGPEAAMLCHGRDTGGWLLLTSGAITLTRGGLVGSA